MNVNAGELNKRIKIIKTTITQNPNGFEEVTKETVRECWAKFNRTSGTEMFKSNADFGEVKTRFLVRYSSVEITRKMLVEYAGKTYNIAYVNNYEDSNEYIEIWCDITEVE
ncbi:phage head closure protein [Anaerosacchariphilus polymeriproducens]|uniref:Head-tail adaptor protein n=1 Tax=Anaerosacchariphilus polymeriproducens TaxID=1812858 RepID=A0A371ATA0_9FIRM|nr:phage head closure protein [Anaerosacchariphilus polymeriproducens]RDU22762.1 head-tail adaptor protein [Anaerosacchariphilus polymeriproducens]